MTTVIPWNEICDTLKPLDGGGEGEIYSCTWQGRDLVLKISEIEVQLYEIIKEIDAVVPRVGITETPWGPAVLMEKASSVASSPRSKEDMLAVFGALRQLHARGWIHGDVHPGNILLWHDMVVLSDFGLATPEGHTVRGRPPARYASPWQLRAGPAVPAMDLYSWVLTSCHLVSGMVCWRGMAEPAIIFRKDSDPVPPEAPWLGEHLTVIPPDPDVSWARGVLDTIFGHVPSF